VTAAWPVCGRRRYWRRRYQVVKGNGPQTAAAGMP
jgi:hypothetical protein